MEELRHGKEEMMQYIVTLENGKQIRLFVGSEDWLDEYNKRSAKLEKELKQLKWWHKQLYEMHLSAVELKIEEGTRTEMVYLGMVPEDD